MASDSESDFYIRKAIPKPFPIQKLPQLAFLEVSKSMDPLEVAALSHTSKKSNTLVRLISKRISPELTLIAGPEKFRVQLGGDSKLEVKIEEDLDTNDGTVFLIYPRNSAPMPTTTCSGLYNGFQNIIDYFLKIFSIKKVSLDFNDQFQYEMKWISQYAKSIGLKLKEITFSGQKLCNFTYKSIIQECNGADLLHMNNLESRRYSIRFTGDKMDLLKNFKSVKFSGYFVILEDLRKLLIDWKNGDSGLIYFEMKSVERFDLPRIMNGLEAEMVDRVEMEDGRIQEFQPNECYRIKRVNGKVSGLVYRLAGSFVLKTGKQ